jgi:hypothetical protein
MIGWHKTQNHQGSKQSQSFLNKQQQVSTPVVEGAKNVRDAGVILENRSKNAGLHIPYRLWNST